jgi:hypothetical protein
LGFNPLHLRDGPPGFVPAFFPFPDVAGDLDEAAPPGSATGSFDDRGSYKIEHLLPPMIQPSLLDKKISPAEKINSLIQLRMDEFNPWFGNKEALRKRVLK